MRSLEVVIDEAMRDAAKVEIEPAARDAGGDPLSALVKAATSEPAAPQHKELAPAVILSVLKVRAAAAHFPALIRFGRRCSPTRIGYRHL